MPKIEFEKKSMEEFLGFDIEKFKELLPRLGISLEDEDENTIVLEINPNRTDWLSPENLARSIRYFLGFEKPKKTEPLDSEYKVIVKKSVKDVRPYTVCAVVELDHLDESLLKSIIQLQEKLHLTFGRNRRKLAIGIYPAEKITFPITFFAENPEKIKFVPLNETREMYAYEILEKHEKGIKYAELLRGKKKFPFFKDAKGNILSMPPIINSEFTGRVTEDTKKVFIEVSGFNLHYLNLALNILLYTFMFHNGKVYKVNVMYENDNTIVTPNFEWRKYELNEDYVNYILGQDVDVGLLNKMGYIVEKKKDGLWIVDVPPYRTDVMHKVDLVEDLAIAYGYDNFDALKSNIETDGQESEISKLSKTLHELMIGLGFVELKTYSLENEMFADENSVKLFNSVNADYTTMRKTLMFNLLKVVQANKQKKDLMIYEIGKVYEWRNDEIKERDVIGIMITHKNVSFIRQVADYLFDKFKINPKYVEQEMDYFIPGRCVRFEGAFLGEVHPKILKMQGISFPVSYLEIPLDLFLGR